MAYPHLHFPALRSEHLAGAALHADRTDLIRSLNLPPGAAIAEVGVAMGDFSEFLLQTVAPSRFVAIDTFTMHEAPAHWGTPSATLFDNKTHLGFYRDRFASRGSQVQIMPGWSHVALAELADASFDLIYLDAGHDYDSVRQDAGVAASKLRPDGFLVFNDYIMFDHMSGTPYGVVPVVNELVCPARGVSSGLPCSSICSVTLLCVGCGRKYMKQARPSFLKKRSKKLLLIGLRGLMDESFLLLFFKKEGLASCFS